MTSSTKPFNTKQFAENCRTWKPANLKMVHEMAEKLGLHISVKDESNMWSASFRGTCVVPPIVDNDGEITHPKLIFKIAGSSIHKTHPEFFAAIMIKNEILSVYDHIQNDDPRIKCGE